MRAEQFAVETGIDIEFIDKRKYEELFEKNRNIGFTKDEKKISYYEERGVGNRLKKSPDKSIYYNADSVAEMLDVSIAQAYKIIRSLNDELNQKGFIIIAGRVPKKYFEEKYYGLGVCLKC